MRLIVSLAISSKVFHQIYKVYSPCVDAHNQAKALINMADGPRASRTPQVRFLWLTEAQQHQAKARVEQRFVLGWCGWSGWCLSCVSCLSVSLCVPLGLRLVWNGEPAIHGEPPLGHVRDHGEQLAGMFEMSNRMSPSAALPQRQIRFLAYGTNGSSWNGEPAVHGEPPHPRGHVRDHGEQLAGMFEMSNRMSPSAALPQRQIRFLTYGTNGSYWPVALQLVATANASGWFTSAAAYNSSWLPQAFTNRYANVLAQPRGAGYWTWKVPLLKHALSVTRKGDFIVYLDAGCDLNPRGGKRFNEYLRLLEASPYDIISFQLTHAEYKFTTPRVFRHFNVSLGDASVRQSSQYVGGVLIMRHGPHLHQFLQAIERALQSDPWLFTDAYNAEARAAVKGFVEGRHDQSISSVARKLLGSVIMADETYPPGRLAFPFWASRRRTPRATKVAGKVNKSMA